VRFKATRAELRQMTVAAFWEEYQEAAEDIKKAADKQQKQQHFKPRKGGK
jgi:hypothetical protein